MTPGIQSPDDLVEGLEILWGNNLSGLRATMRHANTPESGLSMVGMRCAKSSPLPDSAPK